MYKNVHDYCRAYDVCQQTRGLVTQSLTKLVTNFPKEPFMTWGLDLWGQLNHQEDIQETNIFL
jgi:hypothetical protein